jgi:5-methylcytosine-specific restriction endonuclease McrA
MPYNFRDSRYLQWARAIKERDGFTCRVCGRMGVILHSHHLFGWDRYTQLRFTINNGLTLCKVCHDSFHSAYGRGSNNAFQFLEFLKSKSIMTKIVDERAVDGYHADETKVD